MQVRVLPDARAVAVAAADLVEETVRRHPAAVLGLATGSTPLGLYDELVRRHAAGLDLSRTRCFLLDEYVGLPADHPERYRAVIARELTDRVGIPPAQVHAPPADAGDLPAACRAYEAAMATAGGVDLQVLGLGVDGHIAFNMPGSDPAAGTRLVELSEQTLRDNARFFGGDVAAVPRRAVSQGLETITRARRLLLLATGPEKARAARDAVVGPWSPQVPSSALRSHPATVVLADAAAGALLPAWFTAPEGRRRSA